MDPIRNWYEMTLAQMASDSYLDNVNVSVKNEDLEDRLRDGANHYDHLIENIASGNLSATRMTKTMTDDFFKTWQIIDHEPNTSSGFSATLMKHKKTGEYTLSFRSTESKQSSDGGDVERDSGDGANGQITSLGFAYGQLLDMEKYYQQLKDDPSINLPAQINLTGYSLGGHLAQVFTRLHYNAVIHTYTMNGAGFGDFEGAKFAGDYTQGVNERLDKLKAAMADPLSYVSDVTSWEFEELGYVFDASFTPKQNSVARLLQDRQDFIANNPDGYTSIYNDPLFQYAIKTLPDSDISGFSVGFEELFNEDRISVDGKITNLFGHAVPADDTPLGEFVAGSGQIFGEFLPIYIEDQPVFDPDWEGATLADSFLRSFGPGHSISLLADSLAVMDLFQTLDPSITRQQINQIFASASNSASRYTIGFRKAEGDPLNNKRCQVLPFA